MPQDMEVHRVPDLSHRLPLAPVRYESCPAQPARWHELANLFPMLQGEAFDTLVEDIRRNGVREPIVMLDGAILDGRNRYMAARQLGCEYPVTDYDGNDPLGYVVSMNLARRHLSESQRAMVASKLAKVFAESQGTDAKVIAAKTRWDREAAKARISEQELPYDAKAALFGHLDARHRREDATSGKRIAREVYLAKAVQGFKIGVSQNAPARIEALRTASPDIELIASWPGDFSDEKALHKAFRDKRVDGEWFDLAEDDVASIPKFMQNRQLAASHEGPIKNAATVMNVGSRSVERANRVNEDGDESLIAAVESDTVSVSAAADVAALPREEQAEIVARGEAQILEAAKKIRAEKAEKRRAERLQRFVDVSRQNADLSVSQRYPIILADPPWQYDDPAKGANDRAPENHYPTMTLDDICALPVPDEVAADDALLFLWATSSLLPQAFRVIEAWGFEYRSSACWDKEVFGLGSYVRNQHELLLIARRGNLPAPAPQTRPPSVYREKRGAHSAKPAYFHELVETLYPSLPKIELFARAPREGWTVWGNQSGAAV